MTMRKHIHKEHFSVSPERLFSLLHTPSAIRQWWGVASAIILPEKGGTWAAVWGESEDQPDYCTVATISEFQPPIRMVLNNYRYQAKTGPLPFKFEFETEFLVTAESTGASLQVTQDGFPLGSEADEFYLSCQKGWEDTFNGIRNYLNWSNQEA